MGRKEDDLLSGPDSNEYHINIIRKQLDKSYGGKSFGQRITYRQYRLSQDPGYDYYAFSQEAYESLEKGEIPKSGYVRTPTPRK